MAETPLDRFKLLASWVAFINAAIVAYALVMQTMISVSWIERSEVFGNELLQAYFDMVGGDTGVLLISPVIWGVLWVTTGSPRFLPWKK